MTTRTPKSDYDSEAAERDELSEDGDAARTISRRGYLASLTRAGLLGGVSPALVGRASAASTDRIEQLKDQYSTVVDIADAGADDTGAESITPVLDAHAGDDTLFVFPQGRYRMNEEFRHCGYDHFGMVGDDATIVPGDYYEFEGPNRRLFRLGVYHDPGRDLHVEGLTVDQTAPDTGIRAIEAQVSDGLTVRDVDVVGKHDSGTWGPALFDVMDPDGTGTVEGFRAPAGGEWVSNTPNDGDLWRGPTGIMVSRYHEGTVELVDCQLGGFPDNGVYAGNAKGTVIVRRGVFRNSHASSLRIGGHHSKIVGATVIVDDNPDHFDNQRGIRLDQGSWLQVLDSTVRLDKPTGNGITVLDDVESAKIHNSSVIQRTDRTNQAIVVEDEAGPTYVQKVHVDIHGSGNAVEIKGGDRPGEVGVSDVRVTGPASGSVFRNAIRCERANCEFRGLEIDQPGSDYRRALEINADDCLVYGGTFETTHHPIVVNGTGAWIESAYAESYSDYEALRLNESSADVKVKDNTLVGGVLDVGCEGLTMYGNET
ncbi:hypothetical protein M0R89_20480 (plasmid) [Halorussus limi]|uniref:Right-handed parallel beta-helix repeat-containing protein n=1 Tax=Halorussus limi TaxID=2938695 RepID=A0A8U0I0W5_9EURY|nr:hypothetical protein [Halorussus limi]UPV76847.1 hypothetical protein M0R89_20480 [Halorussus limi]